MTTEPVRPVVVNTFAIAQITSAVRARVDELRAADPDTDAAALMALVEQDEPEFGAILTALVRWKGEADATAAALDARICDLDARMQRAKRQAEQARALLFSAMDAAGQTKWRAPEFTLSVAPGRAAVVVTDADALPDEFVRVTRAPDKTLIKAALERGHPIPGAELANGAPTLTVRTK